MLTLGFLVIAVVLQRKEIGIVKEERDDTKKLLEGQTRLTELQDFALKKQIFEQSFFSLLSLINTEKRRFFKADPRDPDQLTELEGLSTTCELLLVNHALQTRFEPQHHVQLDVKADQAFNLVNLLSSAVSLIESAELTGNDRKYYLSMIQGLIDYHTAVCFAWFHASSDCQSPSIARAYDTLSVYSTISPALRDAMDAVVSRAAEIKSATLDSATT